MKLHLFSKNSPKTRVFTEKRIENIYETEIFRKQNYETVYGFTKKVKLFHKNRRFHIQKRKIQIAPGNRPFKNGSLFFLRKKSLKKYVHLKFKWSNLTV